MRNRRISILIVAASLALMLVLVLCGRAWSQTAYTATATGNWNATSTWSPSSGTPGGVAGDSITSLGAFVVTLNATPTNSLSTIVSGGSTGAITSAGTNTLILTGSPAITSKGNPGSSGFLRITGGALTIVTSASGMGLLNSPSGTTGYGTVLSGGSLAWIGSSAGTALYQSGTTASGFAFVATGGSCSISAGTVCAVSAVGTRTGMSMLSGTPYGNLYGALANASTASCYTLAATAGTANWYPPSTAAGTSIQLANLNTGNLGLVSAGGGVCNLYLPSYPLAYQVLSPASSGPVTYGSTQSSGSGNYVGSLTILAGSGYSNYTATSGNVLINSSGGTINVPNATNVTAGTLTGYAGTSGSVGTYYAVPITNYSGNYGIGGSVAGTIGGAYYNGNQLTISPSSVLSSVNYATGSGTSAGGLYDPVGSLYIIDANHSWVQGIIGTIPAASAVLTGAGTYSTASGTATITNYTPTLTLPNTGYVLTAAGGWGVAGQGSTGTYVPPPVTQVLSPNTYGVSGGSTGSWVSPTQAQVQSGVTFGVSGGSLGTYSGGGSGGTLTIGSYPPVTGAFSFTISGNTAASATPANVVAWNTGTLVGSATGCCSNYGISGGSLYTNGGSLGVGTTNYLGSIAGAYYNGTQLTLAASNVMASANYATGSGTAAGGLSLTGSNLLVGGATSSGTLMTGTIWTAGQVLHGSGTANLAGLGVITPNYYAPPLANYAGPYGVGGTAYGTITGCYSVGYYATLDATQILIGYTIPATSITSVTGSWSPPTQAQVQSGITFGVSGGSLGTYTGAGFNTDPGVVNVLTGTTYTILGSSKTGTFAPAYQAVRPDKPPALRKRTVVEEYQQ